MASAHDLELASYEPTLVSRCEGKCELCGAEEALTLYEVPPAAAPDMDKCAMLCSTCHSQVTGESDLDEKHWFCLNESAWSTLPAVQAISLRILNKLSAQDWAQNLSDQLYIEDDIREWAEAGFEGAGVSTKDSNGVEILEGDSVTIIKDLDVKGTSFVAKRGTVVKNVHITGNGDHVEGKVNGTTIYLKASFLKKM